jgi:hypothetical protein
MSDDYLFFFFQTKNPTTANAAAAHPRTINTIAQAGSEWCEAGITMLIGN